MVTQAQIDALLSAMATGVMEVEYNGQKTRYQSIDQMHKALSVMRGELAATTSAYTPSKTSYASFDRD